MSDVERVCELERLLKEAEVGEWIRVYFGAHWMEGKMVEFGKRMLVMDTGTHYNYIFLEKIDAFESDIAPFGCTH